MSNAFEGVQIDTTSFSYLDLTGVDRWHSFTPTFTDLTIVGALTAEGRYRKVGSSIQFQAEFEADTSIESVAGTTWMALPVVARGLSGIAVMTNQTTSIAVGICHLDVVTSKLFLPAQAASGDEYYVCGSYEAV